MAEYRSPFSQRPLPAWIAELQCAAGADDRYGALLAINALAPPPLAVQWSRHALQDADSGVRAQAAKQIGDWKRSIAAGSQPADPIPWIELGGELAALLQDEDPDVRFEAARALGAVDPPLTAARDVLLAFLDDEATQPLMTAVVVSALGQRSDLPLEAMIPRLRKLLEHPQAEVRESASACIAAWPEAVPVLIDPLVAALEDDEPIVRENAAVALGFCGIDAARVSAALSHAERDEDQGVAAAARQARLRLAQH